MTAQAGRNLLLKVDENGAQSFVTVAGLRTKTLTFNAAAIDTTDAQSAGQWRELLEGGGVRRAAVSGSGLFKDAASDEVVRSLFFSGTLRDWQIIIPDFGTISGAFQIVRLQFTGAHQSEVSFEIALESASDLTFVGA